MVAMSRVARHWVARLRGARSWGATLKVAKQTLAVATATAAAAGGGSTSAATRTAASTLVMVAMRSSVMVVAMLDLAMGAAMTRAGEMGTLVVAMATVKRGRAGWRGRRRRRGS